MDRVHFVKSAHLVRDPAYSYLSWMFSPGSPVSTFLTDIDESGDYGVYRSVSDGAGGYMVSRVSGGLVEESPGAAVDQTSVSFQRGRFSGSDLYVDAGVMFDGTPPVCDVSDILNLSPENGDGYIQVAAHTYSFPGSGGFVLIVRFSAIGPQKPEFWTGFIGSYEAR